MSRLVFGLFVLISLSSCSTFKSMYSGQRYATDRPQRAAWVRKTSRWLTVFRRLSLYSDSPRYNRMKKILHRFNIKQLYVFSGRSQASYVGYRSQGLFKLCHQFRKEGFIPWANFRQDRWYKRKSKIVELKVMVKRFAADNKKNNNCFKGIHFDIKEKRLTSGELAQIKKTFKNITLPISLSSHARNLRKLANYLHDATIMEGPGKPLRLNRKLASKNSEINVYPRENLDLTLDNMQSLSLRDIENQLLTLEKKTTKKMGAAIFTLEHLLFKYDREDPPAKIVQ